MEVMETPSLPALPPPEVIEAQLAALEEELRALRRLLRASRAIARAAEARARREALRPGEGGEHAA